MNAHDQKTRDLVLLLASCPIEEFQQGNLRTSERPDDFVLFRMNDWVLTVGDIHKARTL